MALTKVFNKLYLKDIIWWDHYLVLRVMATLHIKGLFVSLTKGLTRPLSKCFESAKRCALWKLYYDLTVIF